MKPSDRFFVNFKLTPGKAKIKDEKLIRQLRKILRKKIGDKIILFTSDLNEAEARISNFCQKSVELEISEIRKNEKELNTEIELYCSILKKENFDFVVQKATEIGVKKIIPIICKNTVKLGLNLERLGKIAKEAAEQSGRGILPEISLPLNFDEAAKEAQLSEFKILFDAKGEKLSRLKNQKSKKIAIFVGPEGGWAKEEIELAKKENFRTLNLGKLNLRAETAAIVGSFLVIHYFEYGCGTEKVI